MGVIGNPLRSPIVSSLGDPLGGASLPWESGGSLPPLLALYLDGTGDYAYVADADALTPAGTEWSVAGWIYLPTIPTGAGFLDVIFKSDYPASSLALRLGTTVYPEQWFVWTNGLTGTSFAYSPQFGGPAAGWCYVAKAFNGALALNGGFPEVREKLWMGPNELGLTFSNPAVYSEAVINDANPLTFSANRVGGVLTVGNVPVYYHDWCMWSRAITQVDVEAHIAGAPSTTGLIRRWFHQRKALLDDGAAYPPVAVADTHYVAMPAALPRTIKRVHLVGDSITVGKEPDWAETGVPPGSSLWRGGWRRRVYDRAVARGKHHLSVGLNRTYEGHPSTHGGWTGAAMTSAALVTECQGSAALTPDARVFAMGTNDINTPFTLGQMQTNFAARMDDLFTGCTAPVGVPTVPLVPPQPGTLRVDYLAWLVATGIPAQVALGRNVQYIPIAFGAGDNALGDTDTHLSDAGYEKAAVAIDAWLAANGC